MIRDWSIEDLDRRIRRLMGSSTVPGKPGYTRKIRRLLRRAWAQRAQA